MYAQNVADTAGVETVGLSPRPLSTARAASSHWVSSYMSVASIDRIDINVAKSKQPNRAHSMKSGRKTAPRPIFAPLPLMARELLS